MKPVSFVRKQNHGDVVFAQDINELQQAVEGQGTGLVAPNPSTGLLLPWPTVHPDPPTVTLGVANAGSVIASSVLYGPSGKTTDVFAFYGADAPLGLAYPATILWSPVNHSVGNGRYSGANWTVEFDWYGTEFEIYQLSNGATYTLFVDGAYIERTTGPLASDGNLYNIHVEFGAAGYHRIRIEMSSNFKLLGIRIGPTDSIWKSSVPPGPSVIATGDSTVESFGHWPQMMGWLLGWRDVTITGAGSTGYLKTNTNGGGLGNYWGTFRERAQDEIYPFAPDIVIVSGSINDDAISTSLVTAEATAFYADIRENLPSATIIVSGYNWVHGSPTATNVQHRDAVRAAALASPQVALYIERVAGPYPYSGTVGNYVDTGWFTGTGKVGTTTGAGNSDLFRSSDGTHPSQAGHDYLGYRHAQAIAAAMPILGGS